MFRTDNPPQQSLLVRFENEHGELVLVDGEFWLAEDLSRLDARSSIGHGPPEHNPHMMMKLRRRYLETKAENAIRAVERYRGKLLAHAQNGEKPTKKQKTILRSLIRVAETEQATFDEYMKPLLEKRETEQRWENERQSKVLDAVTEVNSI